MQKVLFIIVLPCAIVAAAYHWRETLDEALPWLKGWRTVVLNVIPAVGILATDLVGFLAGFSWDALVSAETAAMLALSFNIANIALRFTTTTPVGEN
jgi:hypothetical protein